MMFLNELGRMAAVFKPEDHDRPAGLWGGKRGMRDAHPTAGSRRLNVGG